MMKKTDEQVFIFVYTEKKRLKMAKMWQNEEGGGEGG